MSNFRVAADIGGTFTDFVVLEEDGQAIYANKVSTTPEDLSIGFVEGIKENCADPKGIQFFIHGTTVGLNAFLERKGERTLLITTKGFRDSYIIARGDRKELYTLQYKKPELLVKRRDVHEVTERIAYDGAIIEDILVKDFDPILDKIRFSNIKSVAVCFLHSYINPKHELMARDILNGAFPSLDVTLSHEVACEWREYERASTSTMNAYISPIFSKYISKINSNLLDLEIPAGLHVMQSNGGIISSRTAEKLPIRTLLSGPVGGTIGGHMISQILDKPNLICIDMGGTSFDVSLIINGKPVVRSEAELEGIPLLLPVIDIHTIGAGGGSYAWLEGGYLRVGPKSAGANPGPACYGKGGENPTITDANLFLNRIDSQAFIGGKICLDKNLAKISLEKVSSELKMNATQLAEGMINIINSKMSDAIRTITIDYGLDPRKFSLVSFGGAGPMHALGIAELLDIPEVIIPWCPGTFSAWGMLNTEIRQDFVSNFYYRLDAITSDKVLLELKRLHGDGLLALKEEDVIPANSYFLYFAEMRYVGQEHSILVPINPSDDLQEISTAFHKVHQNTFGHSTPKDPIEFVQLRVAALGKVNGLLHNFHKPVTENANPIIGNRQVVFNNELIDTVILDRGKIPYNAEFHSPLIVEEETATTVVPPGYLMKVDNHGFLVIRKELQYD